MVDILWEELAIREATWSSILPVIQVQYMQLLLDHIKHYPYWDNKIESYNPLTLLNLTEKTLLANTEDQY